MAQKSLALVVATEFLPTALNLLPILAGLVAPLVLWRRHPRASAVMLSGLLSLALIPIGEKLFWGEIPDNIISSNATYVLDQWQFTTALIESGLFALGLSLI